MSDLTQLYQEIILRHNKFPANYGVPESFTAQAQGHNPLCGDEVTVYWTLEKQRLIHIHFQAQGCAISRASASIMTGLLQGKSIAEAKRLFARLSDYLLSAEAQANLGEEMGELIALSGVRQYPSRVKCATLAWHTFLENVED